MEEKVNEGEVGEELAWRTRAEGGGGRRRSNGVNYPTHPFFQFSKTKKPRSPTKSNEERGRTSHTNRGITGIMFRRVMQSLEMRWSTASIGLGAWTATIPFVVRLVHWLIVD